MKTKIISTIISFIGFFALTSCDGTTMVYSEQINFTLNADCDEQGINKIEGLYKNKTLPIGENITMSIIVEINSDIEENKLALKQKVIETLKRSSTNIYYGEFHALKTGATWTEYSAYYPSSNAIIGTVTTDFGKLPDND